MQIRQKLVWMPKNSRGGLKILQSLRFIIVFILFRTSQGALLLYPLQSCSGKYGGCPSTPQPIRHQYWIHCLPHVAIHIKTSEYMRRRVHIKPWWCRSNTHRHTHTHWRGAWILLSREQGWGPAKFGQGWRTSQCAQRIKNEGQLQTGGPDGGLLTSAIHIKWRACSVGESCAIQRPVCRRGQENRLREALIGLIAAALHPSSSVRERDGGARQGPRLNKVNLLAAPVWSAPPGANFEVVWNR